MENLNYTQLINKMSEVSILTEEAYFDPEIDSRSLLPFANKMALYLPLLAPIVAALTSVICSELKYLLL